MGLQPIIGYNYGAGLLPRLRRAFWLAVGVSSLICIAGSIFGLAWPGLVARAFTADDFLIGQTVFCLRHCLWAFSVVGFQIIAACFFHSIGAPAKAMFLSLTRQVIFLIPLILWLPGQMGVKGVWLSFPISDLLATAVTAIMIIYQFRQIDRLSALKTAAI